jgi:Flp pilus assembly protein TadG
MKTSDLRRFIRREEGSAIIEFVIYALPLFIPLIIYLTAVNQSAQIQYEARNFARQLARAYVTSPSAEFTGARIAAVKDVFVTSSFAANKIDPNPRIEISCSLNPCLSPNGKVSITVYLKSIFSNSKASATAVQTVDAWRSN